MPGKYIIYGNKKGHYVTRVSRIFFQLIRYPSAKTHEQHSAWRNRTLLETCIFPYMGKRNDISRNVSFMSVLGIRHQNNIKRGKHPIWENKTTLPKTFQLFFSPKEGVLLVFQRFDNYKKEKKSKDTFIVMFSIPLQGDFQAIKRFRAYHAHKRSKDTFLVMSFRFPILSAFACIFAFRYLIM